jgi:hypothetical protein
MEGIAVVALSLLAERLKEECFWISLIWDGLFSVDALLLVDLLE